MKKTYIAILCGFLSATEACCDDSCTEKEAEVQRVPATVTRMRWSCRTTVQESYVWMQPIMLGEMMTAMPVTEWRDVAHGDATGEGIDYTCPRFTLSSDQSEIFCLAFFVTFSDQLERVYEYRVNDYDAYKGFASSSHWVLGLDQAGKVVDVRPAPQE